MAIVNFSNMTDFGELPRLANEASGGLFWGAILYMVWIILSLVLIGYGLETALLVSSFLALIISLLLSYAGLVAWYNAITFVGIILFLFLYITWGNNKKQ